MLFKNYWFAGKYKIWFFYELEPLVEAQEPEFGSLEPL